MTPRRIRRREKLLLSQKAAKILDALSVEWILIVGCQLSNSLRMLSIFSEPLKSETLLL